MFRATFFAPRLDTDLLLGRLLLLLRRARS